MAVQVGSLFASLTLESAGFTRGLSQAERATSASMGKIQRQAGLTSRSMEGVNRSFSQPIRPYSLIAVSRAFDNTADRANLLRGSLIATSAVFGGFAAALTSNVILRYADTYTLLNNQLRTVSGSTAEAKAQFEALDAVATRSRSGLKETAVLYTRLSKAAPNLNPEKILKYTETIQKSLQLGGATAQEAASAAVQFSQAVASNRLGGEELRAILETPLGRTLADGLGVTIGKLREMGTQGKLTSSVVLGALDKMQKGVDTQFSGTIKTLDQAISYADNQFIKYIGSVNEAYGVTKILGGAVVGFADNLDTLGSALKYIVPLVSGLFAAKFLGNMAAGFTSAIGNSIKDVQRVERAAEKAARGISGAWRSMAQESAAKVEALKGEVADYTKKLEEAKAAQAALRQKVATSKPGDFAEPSSIKAVQRDVAALNRLDQQRLDIQNKLKDSQQKLAAVNGAASPKVIAATKQVAEAEAKLNDLLRQQQQLRAAQKGNQTRQLGAAALQSQVGGKRGRGISQVRAAAAEEIKLQKDIEAAQAATVKARENLSKRLIGLTEAEQVAQRAAAAERVAILNQQAALAAKNAEIEGQRTATRYRILSSEAARDKQGMANQAALTSRASQAVAQYESALGSANRAQAAAAKAATILSRSVRFAGAAFSSLVGFLGGPWGIALTAATIGFTVFAEQSAKAAERAARVQDALSEVLGTVADKSGSAQKSLATLRRNEELAKLKQQAEDFQSALEDARKEAVKLAMPADLKKNNPKAGVSTDFRRFVGAGFDNLAKGLTTTDKLISDIQNKGRLLKASDEDIKGITDLVEKVGALAEALDIVQNKATALDVVSPFATAYSQLQQSLKTFGPGKAEVDAQVFQQLMSKVNSDQKKIYDDLKASFVASGKVLTTSIDAYLTAQSKALAAMERIKNIAEQPAAKRPDTTKTNVRRVGDVDPNLKGVGKDVYQQAALTDTLQKLRALRDEAAQVGQDLVNARAAIGFQMPLIQKAFGTKADGEKVKSLIADVKKAFQSIQTGVETGKLSPIQAYNQIEQIRQLLKDNGGDKDFIDTAVNALYDAMIAIPKAEAKYASLVDQIREAATASQDIKLPGGSVIKQNPYYGGGAGNQLPLVPALPTEALPPGQQNAEQQSAQAKVAALKSELSGLVTQVEQIPEELIARRFFGDPIQFQTAKNQAVAGIGELIQKMIDGKVPSEEVATAVGMIKDNLIAAGGNAEALQPFVDSLQQTLNRSNAVIGQIDAMTEALKRMAAAAGSVQMPSGGTGGSRGPYTRNHPAFATGGAFKVGGGGGTDSQLVQFMASPTETVAVFTPSQMKALNNRLSSTSGGNISVQSPITIVASDANSFRASRRQVQMDIADAVTAAVNRTR